jgi:glycosyltransferase involved in cell wall biosynthesis
MKVAIVHDWLTSSRGAERCLEVFCELFPDADLFSLLYCPGTVSPVIERMNIHTSFIQHLPLTKRFYRYYLPFFPMAIERFDFRGYDLIFSSSHCVAKGAIRPPGALHLSYTYTPMRYAWDLYDAYFSNRFGTIRNFITRKVMAHLREWDLAACQRVDHFMAISQNVADRIRRHYNRDASVIYPPVDVKRFKVSQDRGDYYLVVSALVPYKRIDLAIEAFNRLGFSLKIVGWGPEVSRLKKIAGSSVEFLGNLTDAEIALCYTRCRAVIFPGEEDFGIVPLEAQASGKPVIAYAKGGVLETVIPLNPLSGARTSDVEQPTGVYFYEQTVDSLVEAVIYFERNAYHFEQKRLRDNALRFDRPIFKAKIQSFIHEKWQTFAQ